MKIRKSELKTLVEEVMNEKDVQIYGNNPSSFTNKAEKNNKVVKALVWIKILPALRSG